MTMSAFPEADTTSRMLKKSTSFVLVSLRCSTYGSVYASPLRSLRPRWMVFLNILRVIQATDSTFEGKTFYGT